MDLGYDGLLYVLAFDHRDSFQRKLFGVDGAVTDEEHAAIADAKHLVFEGMLAALDHGADPSTTGVLVDEQFSAGLVGEAKARGLMVSMPVEKSGQAEFDFEYGDDFGAHIERFDPDFLKVLVRYNPDGDAAVNSRQSARLRRLSDWLHERDRKFLFELLVPPEAGQLESVGGDVGRFDAELRPELMQRAIVALQEAGVEPDIWKIEGLDAGGDCALIVRACRREGRGGVTCVVLGRGADEQRLDEWLRTGAAVDGYTGFAIGRTIWWAPLERFIAGELERDAAVEQIAANHLHFVRTYAAASDPAAR